ncbi:MAG: LPS-assembly protein, partial [Candidatus Azotimanducaceae bacterium]
MTIFSRAETIINTSSTSIGYCFFRALTLTAVMSLLLASAYTKAEQLTAAETDWHAKNSTKTESIDQLSNLPPYCRGQYVDPYIPQPSTSSIDGTADNAVYIEGKSTSLSGNVLLKGANREIRSPRVVQNEVDNIAEIDGPLSIRESGLLMKGEHGSANIFDGTGVIDSASFLLHQSNFRGRAARLIRDAEGHILLDDATITRCDPTSNSWTLNGKDIELLPEEGYGTARDLTVRIKDVPIIYTPYIRFPLDNKRLSGFLLPGIGYDSDGGADIEIPYYFNIAPNMDATYQLRSLWKRGLIHDGQFRFLTKQSSSEINAGYIRKDDLYDIRDIEDLTTVNTNTSSLVFPEFEKQDRWFLNLQHESGWDTNWKASVNYSAVSDIDYLHDIGGDIGTDSVTQRAKGISSNLTNRRTAALDQIGKAQYRGSNWNAEILLREYQNLDLLSAEQYKQLPSMSLDWAHRMGPVKVKADVNYTYFDKNNQDITGVLAITGSRTTSELSLSLPISRSWGYFRPNFSVVHRAYDLSDVPVGIGKKPSLTTSQFSFDSGLYFDRFFDWGNKKVQQTLEPRIYGLYVEYDDQSDLPVFDASATVLSYSSLFRDNRFVGKDRIGDARQISLGLTSRFLSEKTGAEFLSASIGQVYYFKDREVALSPLAGVDPTSSRSAIFTQARLSLNPKLSVLGSFEWEPEDNRSNRGTFSLKYREEQNKIVNVSYIYTASELKTPNALNQSEESDVSFIWPLADQWSLIGRWNFGWDNNRTIESFAGL